MFGTRRRRYIPQDDSGCFIFFYFASFLYVFRIFPGLAILLTPNTVLHDSACIHSTFFRHNYLHVRYIISHDNPVGWFLYIVYMLAHDSSCTFNMMISLIFVNFGYTYTIWCILTRWFRYNYYMLVTRTRLTFGRRILTQLLHVRYTIPRYFSAYDSVTICFAFFTRFAWSFGTVILLQCLA